MSETIQFRVMDFDCPSCASTVERALDNLTGVESVEVHYTTGRVEVAYDQSVAEPDALARTIEKQGYSAQSA
jgi:copper chaperone